MPTAMVPEQEEVAQGDKKPVTRNAVISTLSNAMTKIMKKDTSSKPKQATKKLKGSLALECFEPIVRRVETLKNGTDVKSRLYKYVTGHKEKTVGPLQDDFEIFGRRTYTGPMTKERGNFKGDQHERWSVMRGWQLYWYREPSSTQ